MAKVNLKLPSIIAVKTGNIREHWVEADTVRDAIHQIDERFRGELGKVVFDIEGGVKRTINVYVNGRNIRFTGELETKLKDGDEITLLPAVSGG
ncbi:MAG: MoaD family protein [Candidatus Bathyarchaeia archaeon]